MLNVLIFVVCFAIGWAVTSYFIKKYNLIGCSGDCNQGRKNCNCN